MVRAKVGGKNKQDILAKARSIGLDYFGKFANINVEIVDVEYVVTTEVIDMNLKGIDSVISQSGVFKADVRIESVP